VDTGQGRASEVLRNGCYRPGRPCNLITAAAMSSHVCATVGRLLSMACLARASAMLSEAVPCSVMRFRAARATLSAVSMSDYARTVIGLQMTIPRSSLPHAPSRPMIDRKKTPSHHP
jgi:hypothetical protein